MSTQNGLHRRRWIETLWFDLCTGFRILRRDPRFSLRVILTFALGVGFTAVAFSAYSAAVLNAFPYPRANELVAIWSMLPRMGIAKTSLSLSDITQIQDRTNSFTSIGAYKESPLVNLSPDGQIETLRAAFVSLDFFSTLGVNPRLGRWLLPEDNAPAGSNVVVLSHSLWQARFGADPRIVGQSIHLNGKPHTIVGIMPPDFGFPSWAVQLWLPQAIAPDALFTGTSREHFAFGRLKLRVTFKEAGAELESASQSFTHPSSRTDLEVRFALQPLEESFFGPVRRILLYVLGATGLILLITVTNVLNLLLVKNLGRQKETSIRLALGASRLRLFQLQLAESLLLSLLGGVVGLLLSAWALPVIRTLVPQTIPKLNEMTLDLSVFTFAFGVSVIAGILGGAITTLRSQETDLNTSLKEGNPGTSILRGNRLQTALVVCQVTLAVVLTLCSGLLVRSLARLMAVDLGFDPRNLLAFHLSPKSEPLPHYVSFRRQLLEEVSALPGIESAAFASIPPLWGGSMGTMFKYETPSDGWVMSPFVSSQAVSPGYFKTMRIPLLQGRTFTEEDLWNAPCVVILNQFSAQAFWPGEDPLQKKINLAGIVSGGRPNYCSVVGVVGNARDAYLDRSPRMTAYYSYMQPFGLDCSALVVRTTLDAAFPEKPILQKIRSLDALRQVRVERVENVVDKAFALPRFRTLMVGSFAGLALFLAAVGIYGVTTYSVSRRTHEVGVRMALGAQPSDILRLVLRSSLAIAFAGLVLGAIGGFFATRLLTGFLYEVRPLDPLTFVLTAFILTVVAFASSYLPARRAAKLDPLVALRYE